MVACRAWGGDPRKKTQSRATERCPRNVSYVMVAFTGNQRKAERRIYQHLGLLR